ncbi:MAG: hypothetical protein H8D45_05645 [Bacteroidetes bacterium]|nr:hypothetical protein [Bacteroidota bacterium]
MNEEERNEEEMTVRSTDWVSKHWQILITIAIVIIWGIRQESAISFNKDYNYKLYIQFTEFKNSDKANSDKVSSAINSLALEVNTLSTIVKGLDDRYPLRKELDMRHFKTAYRTSD